MFILHRQRQLTPMADPSGEDSERSISEAQGPGNPSLNDDTKIARYVEEIELYDKETQKWDRQSKRIIKRYRDDRGGDGTIESQERRYNVLWANTQNLAPALYARNPKPDIQRRFKDADPVGRVTSDILERSITYFCDTDHFASVARQCTLDFLLPGRGTLWVRYVPHFKDLPVEVTDDIGAGDGQSDQAQAPEVIDYEEVIPDYVHRDDFGHNICRTWDEVWCGWRKVYMTRKELKERFGEEKGELPPLDYKAKTADGKTLDDGVSKAVIYELWDKTRRVALWFHKSVPDCLDLRPDPLKLETFFPFPKPLLTNLVNESLIPVPLYVEYQDQAAELDLLTARISMMTRCLKVVGVYDASVEGLNRMFNEGTENELIPIQQWALFAEKGGMNGAMTLLDIKGIAAALLSCYEARAKVKEDLDEITGMSDIIRGNTDPNETASAQKLKSGYAGQRISDMQRDVQRFVRETIRIMTDVIANHFQIETIKQISGVRLLTNQEKQAYSQPMMGHNGGPPMPGQPPMAPRQPPPLPKGVTPDQMQQMMDDPSWEDVEQLIRNQALRSFRIDIETDSTIKSDEQAEKASRIEFLKAAGGFMQQATQAGQQQPLMVPLLVQMMMFGIRAFPVGKELEGAFNSTMQKLEKQAANPQPQPNPEMIKVQGEQQLAQAKMQSDSQMEQSRFQAEQQLNQAKVQGEIQVQQAKVQADSQIAMQQQQAQAAQALQQNQLEAEREHAKLAQELQLAQLRIAAETDMELRKAHIMAAASIEVARINAKADDGAQAEAREASGE